MMREVLQANQLREWEEMEEGPMGEDNNDMWDWDGNNDNQSDSPVVISIPL